MRQQQEGCEVLCTGPHLAQRGLWGRKRGCSCVGRLPMTPTLHPALPSPALPPSHPPPPTNSPAPTHLHVSHALRLLRRQPLLPRHLVLQRRHLPTRGMQGDRADSRTTPEPVSGLQPLLHAYGSRYDTACKALLCAHSHLPSPHPQTHPRQRLPQLHIPLRLLPPQRRGGRPQPLHLLCQRPAAAGTQMVGWRKSARAGVVAT